jgi:hypothetical protein
MNFAAELHPTISSNQMQFFSWNKKERVRITRFFLNLIFFFLDVQAGYQLGEPGINWWSKGLDRVWTTWVLSRSGIGEGWSTYEASREGSSQHGWLEKKLKKIKKFNLICDSAAGSNQTRLGLVF